MTGTGGSIRVLWDLAETGQVTISSGSWTVGGNPVTFPYDITTSTTFTSAADCAGTISVELFNIEIANTPDGTRTFEVRQGNQLIFAPSMDSAASGTDFLGRIDEVMVGVDADETSDFRVQQDARLLTTIDNRPLVAGAAQKSANLSDLSNAATARSNLGLGTGATAGQATTAAQGIVELATSAEVVTGTDTDRVVTPAAGRAAYVQEGAAFADIGKQAGVDNTGTNECAAAIQTALDSFAALGVRAYAKGTFKIASTVTFASNADFADATFNYTPGSGVAVRVGTTASTGSLVTNLTVRTPKVVATAKTLTGWAQVAGSCGVELSNLYASTVHVGRIDNFETNLRCYGRGRGFVYNTVFLGQLQNGKVNHLLGADATGWCNENTFIGGQMAHNSNEGTAVAGTRQIEIEVCTNPVDNNVWLKPSVEGNTAEYHLLIGGVTNRVISGRYEVTGGARLRWASDAARNLIDGGLNAVSIIESFAAGAAYTNELRANGRHLSNGYTWREGGSAAEGLDYVMDPGARVAGANRDTAYRVFRCGNYTAMKRAADANDRMRFDHDNGRIYQGNGTFALGGSTCYIGGTSSGNGVVIGNGSLFFTGDNTYDVGATGNRPRDLVLGRNADMGGWSRAIVHRDLSATPTFAASQTISFSAASVAYLTLTANITSLTLSGGLSDGVYEVHFIQDGTGSRTLSGAAAAIKWAGGAPTLSTGAGKRDIFRFRYDGTSWYELSRSMNVG